MRCALHEPRFVAETRSPIPTAASSTAKAKQEQLPPVSRFREPATSHGYYVIAHVSVAANNVAVLRIKPRCPLQGHSRGGPPYLQAQIVPFRLLGGHGPDKRTLCAACGGARGEKQGEHEAF